MDFGNSATVLPAAVGVSGDAFWTTTFSTAVNTRWVFSAATGVPSAVANSESHALLCVTGPPVAGGLVKKSGVVEDARTGLIWDASVAAVARTWSGALKYCSQVQVGTILTGWRLPSVKEQLTIAEPQRAVAAIDTALFDTSLPTWTSTPLPGDGTKAFAVHFSPQLSVTSDAHSELYFGRCVHDAL